MVLPYIEFASGLFAGCIEYDQIRLQRAHNRGLKLSLNRNRFFNPKLLHKEANLANWEAHPRIALNRLMFKFKYHSDFVDARNLQTWSRDGTLFKLDRPNSVQYTRSLWSDITGTIFRRISEQLMIIHFSKLVLKIISHGVWDENIGGDTGGGSDLGAAHMMLPNIQTK